MKYVVNSTEAVQKIKDEEPFVSKSKTGGRPNLWGSHTCVRSFGYLPPMYYDAVRAAQYVVYSYDTPIAWVAQDGTKVVPDIGYSRSTGQHQLAVKQAWNKTFTFPARGRKVVPASDGPRHGGWPA